MPANAPNNITDVLDTLRSETDGGEVSLGEVLEVFDGRAYGPLLMIPGLITVMPTGAIPGVPSVMGLTVLLISTQMLFAQKRPWLPKPLRERRIGRERLVNAIEKTYPYAEKIERFIKHRLGWASGKVARYAAAITCMCISPTLLIFEVLPPGAFLPGLATLLFGVGLTARDGAVTLGAFAVAAFGFGLAAWGAQTIL